MTPREYPPLAQLISLKGRGALITGGARGIGYCTAQRFAEAGAAILIGDKNADGAAEAAAAIASRYGTPAYSTALDVTKSESVSAFADEGMRLLRRDRHLGEQRGHLSREAVA